jgi:2-polyprenyl-3-methyl-5-hydroxy-6-metoxy-1,4-benzoquinol methylase
MADTDSTEADRQRRRTRWDDLHREREIESEGPDATLVEQVARLRPGTVLDVACGSGTNAVWLASAGWRVTGVDWSAVALEKARARASRAGVAADWIEADLLDWTPPPDAFDLVTVLFLHLVAAERRVVYGAVARAVAPGGHLLVIGHDLTHDGPGPEAERRFMAAELGAEISEMVPGMVVEEAVARRREPGVVDAILRMKRERIG